MENKITLPSKIKRLVICGVIIFIINLISGYFFPSLPVSELGPSSALPPVFGLLFGPWGALGSALGYLFADVLSGERPEIYIVYFFVQLLYAYIPYKLWYILDKNKTTSIPRLDTVGNLTKFVCIMFINAMVMAGFLGFLLDGLKIYDVVSITTLLFALNNFDFSIMLGTLVITAANFYNIVIFKPATSAKIRLPSYFFNTLAVAAIILGIANLIYSIYSGPDIWSLLAGTMSYTMALIYIIQPVTKQIKERKSLVKITLTEKLIIVFIIMGAIIALVTGAISYTTVSYMEGAWIQFLESVYLNVSIILSIFYISAIGFLWYIERNITTPIESISDIVRNYVSDSEGISGSDHIISKCHEYVQDKTEIGILALSFAKMVQDLEVYLVNLKKVTSEKEKINTELNVARKIQADMLPRISSLADHPEFDIYAKNIPAREVGGDFYDFFMVDDKHVAIVIGDVSGKGVPAALFMVIAKTLIKNQTQLGKTPEEVFTTVNNQLIEGNDENMFVTAWMGILETDTGKFTFVNAGHNSPLLKQKTDSKTKNERYNWLKSKPGFILAGMEDTKYYQKEITLKPGDRVFLYTDGVTEAINKDEELFGEEKLLEVVNCEMDSGLEETCTYLKEEIDDFAKNQEQFDDITMLVLEYKNEN